VGDAAAGAGGAGGAGGGVRRGGAVCVCGGGGERAGGGGEGGAEDRAMRGRMARAAGGRPASPPFWRECEQSREGAGRALASSLSNCAALYRNTEDGGLSIDNNGAERSLRGIARWAEELDVLWEQPRRPDGGGVDKLIGALPAGGGRPVGVFVRRARSGGRVAAAAAR